MKKTILVMAACGLLASCGGGEKSEYERYYDPNYKPDTTATAATRPAPSKPTTQPADNTKVVDDEEGEATAAAATDSGAGQAGGAQTGGAQKEALAGKYEQGEKLIAKSDCLACHKVDQKLVGPAYQDVAQKYEFNDKNVDYLAGKIIQGGAGVWGQVPMTPHPDLKKSDAQEMARYILSLRK